MIRHLLKLIWKRKRSNGFLVAELLLTFFVLYGVFAVGLNTWNTYSRPAGFTVENVLNITATEVGQRSEREVRASIFLRIARELKGMNEVADVGFTQWSLYQRAMNMGNFELSEGHKVFINFAYLSDTCNDIMKMDLVRGRWFGPEDDGAQDDPVLINQNLAREVFGDEDPLGKTFLNQYRVIGVVSDYRLYGEFDEPRNLVIERTVLAPADPETSPSFVGAVLVKLNRPPAAALNARILETLQAVEPSWTYNITPAEDLHRALIKQGATPYLTAGVAAMSLVGMVLLGLFGVLWQNIAGRTKEIGLRRAKGANIGHIYVQIIGEMLVVSTVAIVPGILIVAQLVMLDVLGTIPVAVHILAIILAAALLYGMVVVCSLYPGYMATRINPAQALHYE